MNVDLPELTVADAAAWMRWLVNHSRDHLEAWLVLAKRGTRNPTSLSVEQALDEALCHSWIDGQVQRRDEFTYRRRFTPRFTRTQWSRNDIQNVARLTGEGRMHSTGLAAVARAPTDGSWDAADAPQYAMEMPEELAAALELIPRAHATFEILTSQNRYEVVYRISQATRVETRSRRIEHFVAMLRRGETVYPPRRLPAG